MTAMGKDRRSTGLFLPCPCGAKAGVWESSRGFWWAHCPNCGRMVFWRNKAHTEKLKFGAKSICPHEPELKPCKNEQTLTSWCKLCRVRTFVPLTGQ